MDGGSVDPTLTIILALIGMAGLTLGPVLVALIGRGGKSDPIALPADKVMPRAEYDGLLEQMARLDDENDRLARENHRLRDEAMARAIEDARRHEGGHA